MRQLYRLIIFTSQINKIHTSKAFACSVTL